MIPSLSGTTISDVAARKLEAGRTGGRSIALTALIVLVLAGACSTAFGQNDACAKQCTSVGSDCYELRNENQQLYGQCVSKCEKKCEATQAPPVAVKVRYLVVGLIYAPPGCTGGASAGCTQSFVDYSGGSSLGSKISISDSFKVGEKLSADGSYSGATVGLDQSLSLTQTDSSSFAITKSVTHDIQAFGNSDGVDHGQDEFILLLNPTVILRKDGSGTVYWKPDFSKAVPYKVAVSDLRNPATMQPAVAQQLKALGFTNDDYQTILNLHPFGGKVNTTGNNGKNIGTGALGGATDGGVPVLDSRRFRATTTGFPYEPLVRSPNCNGGICNCVPMGTTLKNDFATEDSTSSANDYSVAIQAGASIPQVFNTKTELSFTWTDSETTGSNTDSSQSATVTVACPSANYTGPTFVQVYWDSLFGSFLFVPFKLTADRVIQHGTVTDAPGKPVSGQVVELILNGKTYRTVTAHDGSYRFGNLPGQPAITGTGRIVVRNVEQNVALRSSEPTIIRMR